MSFWKERGLHIYILEVNAVLMVSNTFLDRLTGKSIVLLSDNTTIMAFLKKQGSTVSKVLCDLVREIIVWLEVHLLALTTRYTPRKKNFLADQLGSFRPGPFHGVASSSPRIRCSLRGLRLPLYRFICCESKCKVTFICVCGSKSHDLESGSLSASMRRSQYLHLHPFTLLWHVLLRAVLSTRLSLILVAPFWPQKKSCSLIYLSFLMEEPHELPLLWNLLVQPHIRKFQRCLETLHHHVWKLSNVSSERLAFQEKLQKSSPWISRVPQQQSTWESGLGPSIGVVNRISPCKATVLQIAEFFFLISRGS